MKILVTGATGFVGSHVLAIGTEAGHEMISARRADCDFALGRVAVTKAVSGLLARHEPGALIHLAGPTPTTGAELCGKICEDGTAGLLDALDSSGRDVRLVAAGSATEIGTWPEPVPCADEDVDCDPLSPYGAAKLCQTEAVRAAGGTALRLFNSTGPGQGTSTVAGRIVAQLASDAEKIVIRECQSSRDFVDIRDAARAFLLAATDLGPGIFNVCSGRSVSIGDLAKIACEAAGRPGLEIEVEQPDYRGDFVCGNPAKLEQAGWSRQFTLAQTLADFVQDARGG